MRFIDSFKLFFEKIFDFTNFSVYLLIAISFCFLINNNQIKNGNKLSNGISYFASHNIFKNNKEEKMASIKEYL